MKKPEGEMINDQARPFPQDLSSPKAMDNNDLDEEEKLKLAIEMSLERNSNVEVALENENNALRDLKGIL